MSWHGSLSLTYRRDGERTVAHDAHEGPLRVLKALYPEGGGVCHHVLVHPPGGIAGGDRLAVTVEVGEAAHALITSAGAARFYRSDGAASVQQAHLRVGRNARLEWLPLEAIAFPGCNACNRVAFELAPGARCLGWDLLALGLPAAPSPDGAFDRGSFDQCLEWPGVWLERGRIAAADTRLLDSPLGLAGRRAMATLWFASATPWTTAEREALLDAARAQATTHALAPWAGATAVEGRVVVLRVLAPRIEPLFALAAAVRTAWRQLAWQLDAMPPRVWRT